METRQETPLPWAEAIAWQPPDWLAPFFRPLGWARRFSDAVQQLPYKPGELNVHVQNKINWLEYMRRRDRTYFGHLSNRLSGADLDHVDLDGIVVRQLLEMIGVEPPDGVDVARTYRIPEPEVRDWLARAYPPDRPAGLDIHLHRRR